MTKVEHTVDIQAPIQEVFAALTDPHRTVEWNPNIVEVSGVNGPMRVGSSWRQVTMIMGHPSTLTCTVVRCQPPHEGVLEISGEHQGRTWTRCEPLGSGTRVTQGVEFNPPGGKLGSLVGGLARPAMHRELKQTMARQQAILEREHGAAHGSRTS